MTSFRLSQKLLAGAALAALSGGLAVTAGAQSVVERNEPPAPPRGAAAALVIGPKLLDGSNDDTPLGTTLIGIRLLGTKEPVTADAVVGVQIGDLGEAPRAQLAKTLEPFLGEPLSRKAISDIEAAVAKVYREAGRPFVAVSIPPHDVTAGGLRLRVVEFRLGAVAVAGAPGTTPDDSTRATVGESLRVTPGAPIDAGALEEDIDWLNRNPYRHAQGIFAPGDELGSSNLTLSISETKPWQVFAGYGNTGTKSTGMGRVFAGGAAMLKDLGDTLVSYQFTANPDTASSSPGYLSHSARIDIPLAPRQALEISGNYVSTTQIQDVVPGVQLLTKNITYEIPILYRSAISNFIPDLYAGDVIFGVEGKHASRQLTFAGTPLGKGDGDVFQLVAGWSLTKVDAYGSTAVDLRVKGNPGGVLSGNNDGAWSAFTGDRMTNVRYAYGTLDATRTTDLGDGLGWVAQFSGILASGPLPDTELAAPGGCYGVRGYLLDDGTMDRGFSLRDELRLPGTSLFDDSDNISPFLFVDVGYGRSAGTGTSVNLASAGAGADYRYSSFLSAGASLGFALRDAAVTKAGDALLTVRVTLSY